MSERDRIIVGAVETIPYDLSISSHDGCSTTQGTLEVVYLESKETNNFVDRMEDLRKDRVEALAGLTKNTIGMRLVAVEAEAVGYSAYRIAKLLGVTTRTVYAWLRA